MPWISRTFSGITQISRPIVVRARQQSGLDQHPYRYTRVLFFRFIGGLIGLFLSTRLCRLVCRGVVRFFGFGLLLFHRLGLGRQEQQLALQLPWTES